jgi:hypothetical protein
VDIVRGGEQGAERQVEEQVGEKPRVLQRVARVAVDAVVAIAFLEAELRGLGLGLTGYASGMPWIGRIDTT